MRSWVVSTVLLVLVGCGTGGNGDGDLGGGPDVAPDVADPGVADARDAGPDEGPGDDGTDAGPQPYEGGAKAKVAEGPADLVGGPAARGTVGDIVLANRHVRFVVRTGDRGLFSPCAGVLLDADRVRGEGAPDSDRLIEMFPMVGMARVLCPQTIDIVDDGTYSGTAIVRLHGTDGGFPLLDSILPTVPADLDVTMDYVLRPDARHVEIAMRIVNPWGAEAVLPVGQILQFGDSLDFFADFCGTDDQCITGRPDLDWLAAGSREVSYGLTTEAGSRPQVLLSEAALLMVQVANVTVPSKGEVSLTHHFLVGDGTIEDVVRQVRGIRGQAAEGTLVATVTPEDAATAPADVLLSVQRVVNGAWVTSGRAGPDGKATFQLPPGTYDLVAELPGTATVTRAALEVTAGQETAVAVAPATPGRLSLTAKDGDGMAIEALVQLQAGHDAPWTQGALGVPMLARKGVLEAPVVPGDYTVVVSKGFEWDAWVGNVTVVAGDASPLAAVLHRVVDTTGELAMDTHDHSELSVDSRVAAVDRLYNALAMGLEVYATTDHDHFGTLQPWVEAEGLQDRIVALPGNEVSPVWGHTAMIGCEVTWAKDTYYEVPLVFYGPDRMVERNATANEIWDAGRNTHGCDLLLIAHPWDSKGLLDTYPVDGTNDPAIHKAAMDVTKVDGLEILNADQSWGELDSRNMAAWSNLLRRGYHIPAVGGSDQHYLSAALGHPRNLVAAGTDLPGEVAPEAIYAAIQGYRSQVVGGPILRLTVEGKGSGEVATAPGGIAKARLEIHAAPWVPVDTARIYVNGALVVEQAVAPGTDVVRGLVEADLVLESDAFVVAVAGSRAQNLGVAVAHQPSISVTNPVFVDVDGEGYLAVEDPARSL